MIFRRDESKSKSSRPTLQHEEGVLSIFAIRTERIKFAPSVLSRCKNIVTSVVVSARSSLILAVDLRVFLRLEGQRSACVRGALLGVFVFHLFVFVYCFLWGKVQYDGGRE